MSTSKAQVGMQAFQSLDLRLGEVCAVEAIHGTRRLLKIVVDLGEERRTLVAGLAGAYQREELLGKKVVVLANMTPAVIHGVRSEGMLLGAGCGSGEVALLTVDRAIANGTPVA